MKLQSMTVIFSIIVIPITLILSAYIGVQIDTAALQQKYDTYLLGATHDAVVAFQINTLENEYSTVNDSLRRDLEATINTFFTSLGNNFGMPAASSTELKQYVPAIVITLYDGYYIYSPIETEYEDSDGNVKTKYEHALKPYIHYAVRYKDKIGNDVVVNYSLDNYITVYGYMNGQYISRSGYLIADYNEVADDGTEYKNIKITDPVAIQYYEAAKNFTNWINTQNFKGGKTIAALVTPENAVDANGEAYEQFSNDSTKILNVTGDNDPENNDSAFNKHKREAMVQSIQSNLNNAIYVYDLHTTASHNFRMPVLTQEDWDKILTNVNIVTFMQGMPVGTKTYNNYAIVTSTKNKQFVDKDLLYYIGDGYYHKIDCPHLLEENNSQITGYRSIAFDKTKDENGNYVYEHKELACYTCIVDSTNTGKTVEEIIKGNYNLTQAYYNTIARERWKLNKTQVATQDGAEEILDTGKPVVTAISSITTNSAKITATDERTEVVGYAITTTDTEPNDFTPCTPTKNLWELQVNGLKQETNYYAWAKDTSGNISYPKKFTTNKMISSQENIKFSISPTGWTNKDVEIIASGNLEYEMQISTQLNFDSNVTKGNKVIATKNQILYARITDSTNQANGYVSLEIKNIDKTKPVITKSSSTTNSITITAVDEKSGIVGYNISTTNSVPDEFTKCANTKELETTISNLKQNTTYYIWVKDEAGNISEVNSVKTKQVIASNGNITLSINPTSWTNGNIRITGNTTVPGYLMQLSTTTTFPNTAIEVKEIEVSKNQTIYARLVDNTNQANGYATLKITKIDKLAPNAFTPLTTSTTNSITVVANTTDQMATAENGSSGIAGYRFSIDNGNSWTGYQTNGTYTFSGLTHSTTYNLKVQAKDNAGNITTGNVTAATAIPAYTVTFNANGGVTSTTSKTVIYGNTYGTLPTPTKSGTSFLGWFTAPTGGTKITAGTVVTTATNHTLYARWGTIGTGTPANAFDGKFSSIASCGGGSGPFYEWDLGNWSAYNYSNYSYEMKYTFTLEQTIKGVTIYMPTQSQVSTEDGSWVIERGHYTALAKLIIDGTEYGSVYVSSDGNAHSINLATPVNGKNVTIKFNRNTYYVKGGQTYYHGTEVERWLGVASYATLVKEIVIQYE